MVVLALDPHERLLMKKRLVFLSMLTLISGVGFAKTEVGATRDARLAKIVRALEAHEKRLRTLRVTVSESATCGRIASAEAERREESHAYRWTRMAAETEYIHTTDGTAWRNEEAKASDPAYGRAVTAFDGKFYVRYPLRTSRALQENGGGEVARESPVDHLPTNFGFRYRKEGISDLVAGGILAASKTLSGGAFGQIQRLDLRLADGRKAVVDLAVDHQSFPIKVEIRSGRDNFFALESFEVTRLVNVAGIELPAEAKYIKKIGEGIYRIEDVASELQFSNYTVNAATLKPSLAFPVGQKLYDFTDPQRATAYRANEQGELVEVNVLDGLPEYEEAQARRGRWTLVIAGSLSILTGVGAFRRLRTVKPTPGALV